nr:uncharacterized protein LOC109167354 [Ipomoea batatas]GME07847.1 uncharacterized protein LOC109167354 [Ipomoea batatas]
MDEEPDEAEWWEIQTDGAASTRHYSGGLMIITPEGFHLYCALQYQFRTSNNEAKFETVIGSLCLVHALKAMRVRIKTDSQLVVSLLTNECEPHEEKLKIYNDVTEDLLGNLTNLISYTSQDYHPLR